MAISKNIKRLRMNRDWTQEQLAEKVGVTRSTVTQWETGWSKPRMGAVEKLAAGYLGRPIGTLQFTFDYFKALAFDGYSVKVKAKKIGMYSANIPELVLLTPPKVELRQWWNSRKFFGRPIPFGKAICVVINGAYIENDINPIPKASRIEILKEPLKDGSKSKPDIVVYADGVPFTRFKYKRYAYEELERMISGGIVECGIDLHEDFETERKYRLYIASE